MFTVCEHLTCIRSICEMNPISMAKHSPTTGDGHYLLVYYLLIYDESLVFLLCKPLWIKASFNWTQVNSVEKRSWWNCSTEIIGQLIHPRTYRQQYWLLPKAQEKNSSLFYSWKVHPEMPGETNLWPSTTLAHPRTFMHVLQQVSLLGQQCTIEIQKER